MTHPDRLVRRVYRWQLGFSFGAGIGLAWAVPLLLQLYTQNDELSFWLLAGAALGATSTSIATWFSLRRYRFLLQALSLDRREGTTTLEPSAVAKFAHEPGRLTGLWLALHSLSLGGLLVPFRPTPLDWTAALSVALLATLMLATTCLPMHVLIRHDFLEVLELAPEALMKNVIAYYDKSSATRGRINRRIVVAVATPVLFVALGSALIVNAHMRRDDEKSREETARVLARAALELRPGGVDGLERALARAERLGFPAQISSPQARYGVIQERSGIAELTTPLDTGSATVRFDASTVEVMSVAPVIVSLLATIAAAILGYLLGNLLSTDLYYATRGVRLLGASPAARHQHTGVLRAPQLRLIADLGAAIDALTARFAVFAQAQENAIDARSAAVRARGLFFASVSHDLKAPLNSILGFTHVVAQQPLSQGQEESLEAIHSRARELLALIETILDAARVEEGHLSLVTDEVSFKELFDRAIATARQLSSGYEAQIFEEIEDNIPPLLIDRIRITRALATLIAYSIRTNQGGKMWIRAERESESSMRIDVDVPKPGHPPTELERMLSPATEQPMREHRGLSLGLRLARSVVKLHKGSVRVVDRGKKGAMFCVQLPTAAAPLPTASAPLHSIPAPPSSRPPSSHPPASRPPQGLSPQSLPPGTARQSQPPSLPPSSSLSLNVPSIPPSNRYSEPSSRPSYSLPTQVMPPWVPAPVTSKPPSRVSSFAPPAKPAKRPTAESEPRNTGSEEYETLQSIPRPPRLPRGGLSIPQPGTTWDGPREEMPEGPFTHETPSVDVEIPQSDAQAEEQSQSGRDPGSRPGS